MTPLIMKPPSTSYLPHLDGLRALALLGVLLFHFEVPPFSGGFAGVDVFLSLSGYLITRNILHHLSDNTFSLRSFYTRRFFRLYPAATVTVFSTVSAAFFVFPDALARETASSGLASMLFSSNAFFHAKSGYFDSSATLKPLLHTWSLSLEEQFYFLWAPLLLLVWTLSSPFSAATSAAAAEHTSVAYRRMAVTLSVLIALSLAFGVYFAQTTPSWGFFELPARIYQFAAGALLHVCLTMAASISSDNQSSDLPKHDRRDGQSVKSPPSQLSSTSILYEMLSTVALFAIPVLYIVIPRDANALQMIPVTLVTLVLIALPNTMVSMTVLCNPFMRYVGSLSYSCYLAHWPIYVYGRFLSRALGHGDPHPLLMLLLSAGAAQALKWCVEDPVRSRKRRVARLCFLAAVAATLGLCLAGMVTKGFGFRVNRRTDNKILSRELERLGLPKGSAASCDKLETIVTPPGSKWSSSSVCRVGATGRNATESKLVFFGNSFMGMWMPALHLLGNRRNEWYRVLSAYSCVFRAKEEIESVQDDSPLRCRTVLDRMWREIDQLPRGSTVVLSLMWGFSSENIVRKRFTWITKELSKRNLGLVVIGEPPGLHPQYERFFNCHDVLRLPVGSLLKRVGAKRTGRVCGADPEKGFRPVPERRMHSQWCENVLNKELDSARYVNMFTALCRPDRTAANTDNGSQAHICRVPVGEVVKADIIDPGYERDRTHLSTYGSYNLANVFEKLVLNNTESRDSGE